jgi:gamma-glutamyl phosphate reductase
MLIAICLVSACVLQRNTRIPVLGHADGICHAYVDAAADLDMAKRIVVDSKVQWMQFLVSICLHYVSHSSAGCAAWLPKLKTMQASCV